MNGKNKCYRMKIKKRWAYITTKKIKMVWINENDDKRKIALKKEIAQIKNERGSKGSKFIISSCNYISANESFIRNLTVLTATYLFVMKSTFLCFSSAQCVADHRTTPSTALWRRRGENVKMRRWNDREMRECEDEEKKWWGGEEEGR